MARALYYLAGALRETGQALDRIGMTLAGNMAFKEQCTCLVKRFHFLVRWFGCKKGRISLALHAARFSYSYRKVLMSLSFGLGLCYFEFATSPKVFMVYWLPKSTFRTSHSHRQQISCTKCISF